MIHHYFLRKHYVFLTFIVVVVNYTVFPCEKNITPLSFAIRIDNRMSHDCFARLLAFAQALSSQPATTTFFAPTRKLAGQESSSILPSFPRHLWSIWLVRITSYSYSFICLSCLFLWNKEVDGAEHSPPTPRPAFLSLNYFSLVLSFLFSVPERLENLVKVGQTLLRKHSGSGVGRIRIRGSSRMTWEKSPAKLMILLYAISP